MKRLLLSILIFGGCAKEEPPKSEIIDYEYTVPDCPHDRNPTLVCINAPECFWICSAI